jgi:hypothetical protein
MCIGKCGDLDSMLFDEELFHRNTQMPHVLSKPVPQEQWINLKTTTKIRRRA